MAKTPELQAHEAELAGIEAVEECQNCGGEGLVWGCFEDTCVCIDADNDWLGCAPARCDWCRPLRTQAKTGA